MTISRYLLVLFVGFMFMQGYAAVSSFMTVQNHIHRATDMIAMGIDPDALESGSGDHTVLVYDSLEPATGASN